MIFSSPANAPATMNSTLVVSIWMNSCAGACGRPAGHGSLRSLEDLQQGLLDALSGDVAGDDGSRSCGDLVDLVDVMMPVSARLTS